MSCAGTPGEISQKRDGTWVNPLTGMLEKACPSTAPETSRHVCSDGGYDATAILWTSDYLSTDPTSTVFACDYGTSTSECNPRTQDTTTDIHCARNGNDPSGSCHDSCWVDTDGNVYHTDEQFDTRTVANGGTIVVDTRCHDGGPNSVSNRCGFGTMSTRCGPARTVAYCTTETLALGNCDAYTSTSPQVVRTRGGVTSTYGRRLSASSNVAFPPPPPPRVRTTCGDVDV